MAQREEGYKKALLAAAVGTAVVALCCFTPLLVIVLGAAQAEEGHARFPSNGFGQQGLAGARWPHQQHALGILPLRRW